MPRGRKKFVYLTPTTRINPDLVELLTVNTSGGREVVVIGMMSGQKITLPSSKTLAEVEELLENDG